MLFFNWIQSLELDASLFRRELPVDGNVSGVAASLPGSDFAHQGWLVWDTLAETLAGQYGQFALRDVEPTAVLGRRSATRSWRAIAVGTTVVRTLESATKIGWAITRATTSRQMSFAAGRPLRRSPARPTFSFYLATSSTRWAR